MAKAGQTKTVTTNDKDFDGSGVEGQKGQDTEPVTPLVDPADTEPVTPLVDPADTEPVTPLVDPADTEPVTPSVDPADTDQTTPEVITGEHVLQIMRDKGLQV